MSTEKRTVFFIMVRHPLKGRVRVGNTYPSKRAARGWVPFVRAAWRGLPVMVSQFTLTLVDGVIDAKSRAILDKKYNLDAPESAS